MRQSAHIFVCWQVGKRLLSAARASVTINYSDQLRECRRGRVEWRDKLSSCTILACLRD